MLGRDVDVDFINCFLALDLSCIHCRGANCVERKTKTCPMETCMQIATSHDAASDDNNEEKVKIRKERRQKNWKKFSI